MAVIINPGDLKPIEWKDILYLDRFYASKSEAVFMRLVNDKVQTEKGEVYSAKDFKFFRGQTLSLVKPIHCWMAI